MGALALVGLSWVAWAGAWWWVPRAVDLARALPGVGFGRMHRFEQQVLEGLDRWEGRQEGAPSDAPKAPPEALRALWPPPPLLPRLTPPMDGEGQWREVAPGCWEQRLAHLRGAALHTRLRADPARPDVVTELLALDLRRLRVHVIPGSDDDGGGGLWPEAWRGEVVAAFNGGFQPGHGAFGLVTPAHVVRAPLDGAATLALDEQGRAWMGAWTPRQAPRAVELRQNLQLLLDDGHVEPQLWLLADGRREVIGHSATRRSGLCLTPGGALLYLWTPRGRAQELGEAMLAAGCERGMHLDLNAFQTGFEWLDAEAGCAQRAAPAMTDHREGRWLEAQRRDFFVVTARPEPLQKWGAWGATSPPPAALP